MPDQTLAQAMEKAHHAIQDSGPMLLSLACDNPKFILEPDGTVLIESHGAASQGLIARFPSGRMLDFTTHLHGGWLPIPVRTAEDQGITYRQTSFVAPYEKSDQPLPLTWLNRRPLGVVEYSIENRASQAADISLEVSVTSDWHYLEYAPADKRAQWLAQRRPRLAMRGVREGAVIQAPAGNLLAYLDTRAVSPLEVTLADDVLQVRGSLPSGSKAKCCAYLPRWSINADKFTELAGGADLIPEVERYWKNILGSGTQIQVPDPMLMDLLRASQVHALIACRNEADGQRIEQWGASTTYRGLNALYYTIPAMDLLGFHDFASRALEYYIHRYTPDGLLSDGYTLAGIGWHLELFWDHYLLTRDVDWLRKASSQIERAAWFVVRQKEKTKQLDAQGNKLPEYGLTPPGVTADWSAYNYYFCLAAYFYDGLESATKALGEISYEDTRTLQAHLKDFRENILRAYHWAQARTPVNALRNGTWVPPYPSQVPLPGTLGQFFPGEDDNRPVLGCYDVELGAHNMVPLGVLDAKSADVSWMLDHMEDFWFLAEGWHDFPAIASEKDWFNLGGFSKVQPNLCRVAEIYARRDDVKPFIRAYFNFIPPQINKQNLTFWEDFTPDSGAWGSTEGSGYFLLLTRLALVMEREDELWLAPLMPNQWLRDALEVNVSFAPTHFGPVTYSLRSQARTGLILAEITPPTRTTRKAIVLRLRHPEGRPMRKAKVTGAKLIEFDAAREYVRFEPGTSAITVKATY